MYTSTTAVPLTRRRPVNPLSGRTQRLSQRPAHAHPPVPAPDAYTLYICNDPGCRTFAQVTQTAWQRLVWVAAEQCACCGGAPERRFLNELLPLLLRTRAYRLLLVGIAPAVAHQLQSYLRPLGLHIEVCEDSCAVPPDLFTWSDLVVLDASASEAGRYSHKAVLTPGDDLAALCVAVRRYLQERATRVR